MPLSTTEIDTLLTSWASSAAYMSAHSAYSATGGNELSGGSYARVAVTWGSASGGSISLSGSYSINAPASSSVGWVGFWTASSGGTFLGMIPGGNYTAYTFTAPASTDTLLAPGSATYATNQTVVVFPTAGSTLPAGLTAGTVYFAISVSGDSLELSTTSGGSAINITADGSGIVQAIAVESFSSAGTYSVTGGQITGV